MADDPNTLSFQHFDGDYTDSSSYGRTFYSQNRSTSYVDSGSFGKAVSLPNGSAAGVTIPNLSSYSSLSFDFRVYFNDISSLGVYFGDTNLFQKIPAYRSWKGKEIYSDDGYTMSGTWGVGSPNDSPYSVGSYYNDSSLSDTISSTQNVPSSYTSSGYEDTFSSSIVGVITDFPTPTLYSRKRTKLKKCTNIKSESGFLGDGYREYFLIYNYASVEYRSVPTYSAHAEFAYDSYKNQWVSMRVTISGGRLYYFVNGDLVGSGSFIKPTADKFYIKSSGTLYLDELRVTTGDLASTGTYNPPSSPYDTNKVLALPDNLTSNTLYVQYSIPVTGSRIGGVRPSNPSKGFLYIPLHEDHTAISGILDGLISLCTKTLESLKNLVDLFGSFGDALGILWTWLPADVMLVLVAGVTVFIFVALLKLFMK